MNYENIVMGTYGTATNMTYTFNNNWDAEEIMTRAIYNTQVELPGGVKESVEYASDMPLKIAIEDDKLLLVDCNDKKIVISSEDKWAETFNRLTDKIREMDESNPINAMIRKRMEEIILEVLSWKNPVKKIVQ